MEDLISIISGINMNVNSCASFRVADGTSPNELMGFGHVHTQGVQHMFQVAPTFVVDFPD